MTTEISTTITPENAEDIVGEIEQAFYDIPFENSAFQTESFVIASQITPERAYRAIGLRMHSKLSALREAQFGRMKEQVDLDEIDYKLSNPELDQFSRRREEIKKLEILSRRTWTDKLINDAVAELNILYKHFKTLPKYTREQFEQAEKIHFTQKLQRQVVGIEGAKEALINMNEDTLAIQKYEEEVLKLGSSADTGSLLKLTSSLSNILK